MEKVNVGDWVYVYQPDPEWSDTKNFIGKVGIIVVVYGEAFDRSGEINGYDIGVDFLTPFVKNTLHKLGGEISTYTGFHFSSACVKIIGSNESELQLKEESKSYLYCKDLSNFKF